MARWYEKEIGMEECPECGANYKVTILNLPLRVEDNFKCSCGNVLRSWSGTLGYTYEFLHYSFRNKSRQSDFKIKSC